MQSICGTVRAPRCHLIRHLPSHQSPTPGPVGPLQRGNQRRSLPERKTQKKVKRSSPMFMNRSTQFTKDRKTGHLSASLANSYLSGQKEGGQSNCRLQVSCDRFFHLRSHQSNFSGLPPRPTSLCAGCIAGGVPD